MPIDETADCYVSECSLTGTMENLGILVRHWHSLALGTWWPDILYSYHQRSEDLQPTGRAAGSIVEGSKAGCREADRHFADTESGKWRSICLPFLHDLCPLCELHPRGTRRGRGCSGIRAPLSNLGVDHGGGTPVGWVRGHV